jgi:GAF domain-containing protein
MAVISVIDRNRQWFAARHGTDAVETPRELAFCAHAIHRPGEALVIPDTCRDQRFAAHPMVQGEPHVRFYAGMPLVDRNGYALGALCVADSLPRTGVLDLYELKMLAREAERLVAR